MTPRRSQTQATRTGPELRRVREAAGIPATRLAATLGIGRPRVATIENSVRITADVEARYVEAVEKATHARAAAFEEAQR